MEKSIKPRVTFSICDLETIINGALPLSRDNKTYSKEFITTNMIYIKCQGLTCINSINVKNTCEHFKTLKFPIVFIFIIILVMTEDPRVHDKFDDL